MTHVHNTYIVGAKFITKWFQLFFFSSPFSPSSLFPDVVNCMQTDNLELKKLVYLYLMNYAKSQPDMAIMAVNSFVKASHRLKFSVSPSPLDGL